MTGRSPEDIDAQMQLDYVRLIAEIETRMRATVRDEMRSAERAASDAIRKAGERMEEQIGYVIGTLRDSGPAARANYRDMVRKGHVLTVDGWLLLDDKRDSRSAGRLLEGPKK